MLFNCLHVTAHIRKNKKKKRKKNPTKTPTLPRKTGQQQTTAKANSTVAMRRGSRDSRWLPQSLQMLESRGGMEGSRLQGSRENYPNEWSDGHGVRHRVCQTTSTWHAWVVVPGNLLFRTVKQTITQTFGVYVREC